MVGIGSGRPNNQTIGIASLTRLVDFNNEENDNGELTVKENDPFMVIIEKDLKYKIAWAHNTEENAQ